VKASSPTAAPRGMSVEFWRMVHDTILYQKTRGQWFSEIEEEEQEESDSEDDEDDESDTDSLTCVKMDTSE